MKTIICGPPHSGKSVFTANLIRLLPSGNYLRISANGDGEGVWTNNPDQKDVMRTRIKGTNTEEDFKNWTHQVECAHHDIVIVDIGGRLQEDKIPFFKACDTFVVVSQNSEGIDNWVKFGTSLGCKCLGAILSEQGDLREDITGYTPYVTGTMSGLERSRRIEGSRLLNAIADAIVSQSGFKRYTKPGGDNVIDMYDIGIKLGMSRSWKTKSGIEVHNVWYQPQHAARLNDYLKTMYWEKGNYKIYGARSIWASCLAAVSISNKWTSDIEVHGISSDSYIPISKLPVRFSQHNAITTTLTEDDEHALLSVKLPPMFSPKTCRKVSLPPLDPNKKLLLSGKMPNWLAMSIVLSYRNKEKYVHVPGIGYIKVEDRKHNRLGEITQGISHSTSQEQNKHSI